LRDALFSVLSGEPTEFSSNPEAKNWAGSLTEIGAWTANDLEQFVRFVTSSKDATKVLFALDESKMRILHQIDPGLWTTLALRVCDWAQGAFDFEYCDVLVGRLELIQALGDLECKARATVAAAVLGASHRRWYVMRRLILMCGPHISERTASRIAIQIRVDEAQHRFCYCADELKRDYDAFHPKIAEVIRG
jgi:hypothetical protein